MADWEQFDEKSILEKKEFHSSLNIENITDPDYRHTKKVYKELNNKDLGGCHNLYVQSNTLLLGDTF